MKEQVKNDLYSFSTRDLSATLIETKGEIPPARVGHASALVSSVLIVWGGDTKTNDADKQDEGLYLLNLGRSDRYHSHFVRDLTLSPDQQERGSGREYPPWGRRPLVDTDTP